MTMAESTEASKVAHTPEDVFAGTYTPGRAIRFVGQVRAAKREDLHPYLPRHSLSQFRSVAPENSGSRAAAAKHSRKLKAASSGKGAGEKMWWVQPSGVSIQPPARSCRACCAEAAPKYAMRRGPRFGGSGFMLP